MLTNTSVTPFPIGICSPLFFLNFSMMLDRTGQNLQNFFFFLYCFSPRTLLIIFYLLYQLQLYLGYLTPTYWYSYVSTESSPHQSASPQVTHLPLFISVLKISWTCSCLPNLYLSSGVCLQLQICVCHTDTTPQHSIYPWTVQKTYRFLNKGMQGYANVTGKPQLV